MARFSSSLLSLADPPSRCCRVFLSARPPTSVCPGLDPDPPLPSNSAPRISLLLLGLLKSACGSCPCPRCSLRRSADILRLKPNRIHATVTPASGGHLRGNRAELPAHPLRSVPSPHPPAAQMTPPSAVWLPSHLMLKSYRRHVMAVAASSPAVAVLGMYLSPT